MNLPTDCPKDIILRPATIADALAMGDMAHRAYADTPLTAFLSPRYRQYPLDHKRGFQQRVRARMYSPRNLSLVAVHAAAPQTPLGYAQLVRLGDDAGARAKLASYSRTARWLLAAHAWLFARYTEVYNWVWPDRATDPDAVRTFVALDAADSRDCWSAERYRNRWHAQSVVVDPAVQGRGIGTRLMRAVLERAELEQVPVCIEASLVGEKLYRKVGFTLVRRFSMHPKIPEEVAANGGGFMVWEPEARKLPKSPVDEVDP